MECQIRVSRPEDEAAVQEICFKTYKDGTDSRYVELSGLRWAVPYIRYEGEHCFVSVDENDRPVGYVVAAPQGRKFRKAFKTRMRREVYAALDRQKDKFTKREYRKVRFYYGRYNDLVPFRAEKRYPAHLHIDILPEYQGGGLGSRMMETLLDHLRSIGCPGIHLGVGTKNTGAVRFYERQGFITLCKFKSFDVVFMGLKL